MKKIRVATWNVNSVKVRLTQLLEWLRKDNPDIVLLQEIKCTNDTFPAMEIEDLGYNLAVRGEKTYNGVAILSKFPLSDIVRELPGNAEDTRARYVEAVASLPGSAMRVASVYVPNGQTSDSDKFQYKLSFLNRFHAYVQRLMMHEEALVIGGDYNIAPFDTDAHDPRAWQGSVLTHHEVRACFRRILNMGMQDAFRLCHPGLSAYSWWDYRANAFASDNGLRIDHLLLSPQAADRLTGCVIEKEMRSVEKASDHTPVVAEFAV